MEGLLNGTLSDALHPRSAPKPGVEKCCLQIAANWLFRDSDAMKNVTAFSKPPDRQSVIKQNEQPDYHRGNNLAKLSMKKSHVHTSLIANCVSYISAFFHFKLLL